MANVFQNWTEARKAARKAQGPIVGWMQCNRHGELDRFWPIVCGPRSGEITGPTVHCSEVLS